MSIVDLRIQNKHDTVKNWQSEKLKEFKPLPGEIIIYDDYIIRTDISSGQSEKRPGLKIGDGIHYLKDLQFISGLDPNFKKIVNDHINNQNIHVSTEDKTAWDNSITYRMNSTDETLSLLKRNERGEINANNR